MNQLNPQQQEAVRWTSTPLLVLAGAGSGKTGVITRKIARLVQHQGISPERITAVTFTNKAAREMRERVGKLLDADTAAKLTVGTFHHLGLTIIRQHHAALGLRRQVSILDDQDASAILADLMHADGRSDKDLIALVQNTIHRWKNELVTPDAAAANASSAGEKSIADIYYRYRETLKAYSAVDFDDLIGLPVELLTHDREVRDAWQNRIHYLLVDEYQDTNNAQYELVRLLVGPRGALTVVGDDDQSIYGWRGAKPENLARLQDDFPSLKVIKLEQNYRSTGRILQAANTLIANNPHAVEKKLWSAHGPGQPLRVMQVSSEEMEAVRVAREIHQRVNESNMKWRDFAVLYRGNHQSRLMEVKLQELGVPYQVTGGTPFFSRTEVKDIMAYLRLLTNPSDDAAFLRIANVPRRKFGAQTMQQLGEHAQKRHTSLLAAAEEFSFLQQLGEAQSRVVQQFTGWIAQLSRRANTEENPLPVLREMLDDMGYDQWLRQNSSSGGVAEKRMENVYFLLQCIERSLQEADCPDFESAVGKLILRDMLDRQEEENNGNQVQLMTLHSAKGLEFPHVYIIGMEENLLPHRTSIEENTIEEERRLAYVGITRARETLTFTLAKQRQSFGETQQCLPSRFLNELPQDLLERRGFGDDSPEERRERGIANMSRLKAMLGD
ncbi:MAG: ATP-dependent DNA helicase Rep [Gammaproteobacteria bacterium]|nr:MAG: ATP-dependent DNA helicase Rep [Gammaproteobacteria bacterium]